MAELDVDFLPFVCDICSGVFCLEHRSRDSHSCPEVSVMRKNLDPEVHTSYPCTFQDCKGRELLPVICQHCQKHFCLVHRHQEDHRCEKLETPKPRMVATQELVQKIIESKKNAPTSKGRKGAKNSATAAKVALMKLKLHATGDKGLPQTERTYFQVFLPESVKTCSMPIFFSSKWTVGKVIDFAAAQASLKNNNNVLTAKKLRLCHPETGEAFKMDVCLQSLLSLSESPLYNGGNVILEYLDNESFGVEDATAYIASS
ncbi:AN1-type zinc finger protein 1 isoform X2 [Hemibagrus wyckioides]|uniref:AN1-type zinc finger protein 1 isoform X2 n=1 Tax=Hemibagrus wyckioides TaxID=337641 RepID=UPI00266B7086|nr:AN1-type zinc finger protein 1 isoform X2 [Hemibagrus wyckioides]